MPGIWTRKRCILYMYAFSANVRRNTLKTKLEIYFKSMIKNGFYLFQSKHIYVYFYTQFLISVNIESES